VIVIAIVLDLRGPILFSQVRTGLRGKRFRIVKFRAMVANTEQAGTGLYVSHDDARITRVGRVLRRFSLDEPPQMWIVTREEMSFVGPRPALPYHLEHCSPQQRCRLFGS
jgi:lipopolysaccharide/colanic/teichoic acid biosynthesis glycosyltransferase